MIPTLVVTAMLGTLTVVLVALTLREDLMNRRPKA